MRIAVVGGGVYVTRLAALVSEALPGPSELRLFARRPDRLARIAAQARTAPGWRVAAAASFADCVDGADAVVLLVRVGGLAARDHDERFPERFGLAGDEGLGPGGLANAFRTVPVLAEMARAMRRACPRAAVYNLVAPLGITTRVLVEEGLDALGVCELPLVTLESWTGRRIGDVRFGYVGLNHAGWFWDVAPPAGLVDDATLAHFGAAPLRYYYEVLDRAAGARLGIVRTPGRAGELGVLAERALERGPAELAARPTPWFDRALVPMLAARFGGPAHEGFANLPNVGLVGGLPAEIVVEVAASCGRRVTPRPSAAPPPRVIDWLARLARAEDLGGRAARDGDRALFADAIAALPIDFDRRLVPALVEAALSAPAPAPAGRSASSRTR